LSIWIAFASALPWGLTIWVAVLFVAQPNVGASIKKGVMRVAGAVAAGLVSIAIYGLFAQMPPLFLASLCGVLGVSVYGMTGTRFPYAWLVLGFTTVLILVKSLAGIDEIETLAFERASLDALGIFILFVADAVFWPVRAEKELREGLARRARQLGETLRQLLEPRSSDPARSQPGSLPASPLVQQLQLVDEARDEIGATPGRERALSRLALLLEGLASRVRLLARAAERPRGAPDPSAREALAQLGDAAKGALEETSRALLEAREPRRFSDGLDRALIELHGWRVVEAEGDRSALVPVLRDVVALLRGVEDALVELARPADGSRVSRVSQATLAVIRKPPRVDPFRLQLALRGAIAGGGVIVVMLAMGWSPQA
jgi:uncharacterized membrane protein YccC